MINKIEIFWGPDVYFEDAVVGLEKTLFIPAIFNHLDGIPLKVEGVDIKNKALPVKNLVIHTDDYGGIKEWALLGFSYNLLQNEKLDIENVWLCNPPRQIYEDVKRNYASNINEHTYEYPRFSDESLKRISDDYSKNVIGQTDIVNRILPAIYAKNNSKRKRPATFLFIGGSGIGKTETANFIAKCLNEEIVRIQFSMQQTTNSAHFIFGAEHGEDSFARNLIRRSSNVVLLDEFDKVSPGFYNAFYQMFDEGLFVDKNYSVDVSQCIFICTSNFMSEDEAEKILGAPIFSRFSRVITFKPLSKESKIEIATDIYKKTIAQLCDTDKDLIQTDTVLIRFINAINDGYYENIRILKNDMEDAVYHDLLIAKGIIKIEHV